MAKLVLGDCMAKVYRKHRYHGVKYIFREVGRRLVSVSRLLAFALVGLYVLIPWLLPLEDGGRIILTGMAIVSALTAFMWQKKAVKIAGKMDIVAAGHDGEGVVAKELAELPRPWAVLNNLALRVNGPIVQIDHIVISPTAVHVLETKAQKGKIIPRSQGAWQVQRRGSTRSIVNPVEQNRAQVQACRQLLAKLGVSVPCLGRVVMTESSTQAKWPITQVESLVQALLDHDAQHQPQMDAQEIRDLAKSLLQFQVSGRAPWQQGREDFARFALLVLLPLLGYGLILAILLWL